MIIILLSNVTYAGTCSSIQHLFETHIESRLSTLKDYLTAGPTSHHSTGLCRPPDRPDSTIPPQDLQPELCQRLRVAHAGSRTCLVVSSTIQTPLRGESKASFCSTPCVCTWKLYFPELYIPADYDEFNEVVLRLHCARFPFMRKSCPQLLFVRKWLHCPGQERTDTQRKDWGERELGQTACPQSRALLLRRGGLRFTGGYRRSQRFHERLHQGDRCDVAAS